ncbi:MAG TPA: sigma 54-interacting transcriptional regulator [Gemmatimonadales bacterium]|nr:sigma 54-interacting transcriptional regulator [Gemmatimonadales bacterium]
MIVGVSPAIRRALALAERYARTRLPVLLVGATGTGKELFAQHIHERSGRPGPLVDVNCCALPRDMVESLLFGHRRGAFTGAIDSTVGHVERSDGGTLFLDELGSLAPEAQGKLLRVLETGDVQPLGACGKRRVDLRVVSAVQDDVDAVLRGGQFRLDLFQRTAGVVIELPPLWARLEDVVPLAEHFADLVSKRLEPGAEKVLLGHPWPGNVRELRHVIERASELVANGTISPDALAESIDLGTLEGQGGLRLGGVDRRRKAAAERAQLFSVCEAERGNARRIADSLGIHRATLFRRLKRAGISLRSVQESS